jgi:hypothetical protein
MHFDTILNIISCLDGNKTIPGWDCVVVTASDEEQRQFFQSQIDQLIYLKHLPTNSK